ncbi:hypothetical protein KAFR_0K01610 [Kazachstania africana CBS 2517]|uniref:separase n=1 Tax=Kazachstania africana (strain ATCC 22294 / BCRC 22015 / CBS 2517 / CECT 1963 / NBRC 1671 / NRRL Y-8276) TaxID=1071382 RepID=H2B1L5_KAZAF|nr:hypothetical protein KAFR_0K01610 [Kazachstania africana CBS 2517]CCF60515.1 hypothetical protein KAFR_0K01610 [Kazachstania africana CBS 2517]
MAKPEDPLKEVTLNTPVRKITLPLENYSLANSMTRGKENSLNIKNNVGFLEAYELSQGSVSEFMKLAVYGRTQMNQLHESIANLYNLLIRTHSHQHIRTLVKQHLAVIAKLLTQGQINEAIFEMLLLYNETNPFKVKNLHDILLSDLTYCNKYYLSTLKVMALQAIIKGKQAFQYQETVLYLFSNDDRYLLKDPKVKIPLLVKLLLNFFTISPKYKMLFGMKFLQYIAQYELDFSVYIKNIELLDFEKQLKKFMSEDKLLMKFLNSYYIHYSRYNQSMTKIMLTDLTNLQAIDSKRPTMNFSDMEAILSSASPLSYSDMDILISHAQKMLESPSTDGESIAHKMQLLDNLWTRIRSENFKSTKWYLRLFDKVLAFVNSNMKKILDNTTPALHLLDNLSEYCIQYEQFKRMSNVVNVIFNFAVISKNSILLSSAAKLEMISFIMNTEKQSFGYVISRFEKLLSATSSTKLKIELFNFIYNIHIFSHFDTFADIFEYCQKISIRCFPKLNLQEYIEFQQCSEVMLSLVYANSSTIGIPTEQWFTISNMLFSSINGNLSVDMGKLNTKLDKRHFLYRYEVLIKTSYLLNLEMSKHITINLSQLTKLYVHKWVHNVSNLNERISLFEIEFLKSLLQYLSFNNFNKIIIDLVGNLQLNQRYYKHIILLAERYLLEAVINLQMTDHVRSIEEGLNQSPIDLKEAKIETLIIYSEMVARIVTWKNDTSNFEKLFIQDLPILRKDLYDIANSTNMSTSLYVKVLLFNINLFIASCKLHMSDYNVLAATIEGKRALKVALSLLKKQHQFSQGSRLALIKSLMAAYETLIGIYIKIGLSKDADFYAKELSRIVADLGEPSIVYNCLHFLYEYYCLTEQDSLKSITLEKANKAFDYIDGEHDIQSLTKYLYDNGEHEKLQQSLNLFFGKDNECSLLPKLWMLKLGRTIEAQLYPEEYSSFNSINHVDKSFKHVLNQIDIDPFFKDVFDSALAIPSIKNVPVAIVPKNVLSLVVGEGSGSNVTDSPRSSNMTPKSKHMRQIFDRVAAINNLRIMKTTVESLNIDYLNNHEVKKVSSLYSLTSNLFSAITLNESKTNNGLVNNFYLSDLPKSMPLYFDKTIVKTNKNVYEKLDLLSFASFQDNVTAERNDVLSAQEKILNSTHSFNVISIDICPVTGNLLLSKIDTVKKRRILLNIPLNGSNARDLDSLHLSFKEARKELQNIIDESDKTTSAEVTSKITTSDARKAWWRKRYDLDKRLQNLLEKVEATWFNGFRGFFSHDLIDEDAFEDFKKSFYNVLHQTLPSRKQFGGPLTFTHIEDWIIELFLKINPQDQDFITMMEDLIYFVLDTLRFHGEENAYDEIDLSVLHVQLEEHIKRYHSRVKRRTQISHTFLIVSSTCHLFPWETLSFMKDISVTRVPSVRCLQKLLEAHASDSFPLNVPLSSNISMVLNPHGDLKRTESSFKELFEKTAETLPGSKLIMNKRPTEEELVSMLTESNLFIYVGHNGGEQYIRSKEIKKLNSVSASFLLGCSSASMKYYGKLEPTGTVYSHLLGGSPLVLGNLWDVTDKDIDKFSQNVFEKIGFVKNIEGEVSGYKTLSEAVTESRDTCHLKFLNGAAPVVYGLPARFV